MKRVKEEWKDIKGYEGLYQISNLGNVKSLSRKVKHYMGGEKKCNEKILSPDINHHGYCRVTLFNKNKRRRIAVHRLVAEAFVENPNGYPEINHKDENPLNNMCSNLEWCSKSYNINYGARTEKAVSHMRKPVLQFDINGNLIARYISASDAGRKTKCKQQDISRVCNGTRKTCGGYRWQYE